MAEFTPTLDELRRIYVDATEGHREECPDDDERAAEFNRAIAVAVRADMQREVQTSSAAAYDEGYAQAETDHHATGFWDVKLRRNPYAVTPSTPNQQGAEQ